MFCKGVILAVADGWIYLFKTLFRINFDLDVQTDTFDFVNIF